jgi:predicted nucleotidyltransferase
MNTQSNQDEREGSGASVEIPVPTPEPALYRYGATDAILRILVDDPYAEFTARELSRATEYSIRSITQALDVLAANGLIRTRSEGNRKPVRIDRTRLSKPDDPILQILQTAFHEPVRIATDRLLDQLKDVRGTLVFGSVARGEADRQSDIDLFVLVAESQASNQRRAHEVAKHLGQQRFEGDRYRFEILVESVQSVRQYDERLRDVFAAGLTIYETDTFRTVRTEVLGHD